MSEDNLSPDGQLRPKWFSMLMNNRGQVGVEGEGDGEDEGEGGAATLTSDSDWRQSLDPSIRDHPTLEKFKTPADVAKSYVEAQGLIGKEKLPVPSKDADPMQEGGNSEYNMIYDRLGRPSDPKSYEVPDLQMPEGMAAVTPEVIDDFKAFSHKIGLLPHQVKALYQYQHDKGMDVYKSSMEGLEAGNQKAETELRKEYGKAWDPNIAGAQNLVTKFGGDEVKSLLNSSGLGNNPAMIKFMVNIAKQFSEDGAVNLGQTQQSILSPDEAQSEISKIKADKDGPYWKNTHPEHKATVQKVADLFAMAFPGKSG